MAVRRNPGSGDGRNPYLNEAIAVLIVVVLIIVAVAIHPIVAGLLVLVGLLVFLGSCNWDLDVAQHKFWDWYFGLFRG